VQFIANGGKLELMSGNLNVLVTGANGFIASHLIPALNDSGYKVSGAVRNKMPLSGVNKTVAVGDVGAQTDWSTALTGVDIVIHLADVSPGKATSMEQFDFVSRQGTAMLAQQAADASVQQFLFLSTAALLPRNSNAPISEAEAFIPSDMRNQKDYYARAKRRAEQKLWEISKRSGLGVTVIRSPLVLGQDGIGNVRLLRRAIEEGLPLPFRSVTENRRDYISADVLSAFFIHCMQRPESIGATFHVSDGRPLSTYQLLIQLGKLARKPPRLFSFPHTILIGLLNTLGQKNLADQLFGDFQLDTSQANQLLGWTPPETGNISTLR